MGAGIEGIGGGGGEDDMPVETVPLPRTDEALLV